ncbi:LysE family transporter [Deinococcus maricopensis]|uniref:Lysine exporter protein (LYSE/YGGA) n=1 Tax=Deinococcus maricopensis (strain DSM 21211 / LMG 22137 / NRRL B-23946 / LB-34) TaxID=709986 RepID=E8U7X7_DEIML|nr:LysE family transporter [Deinococcus maricopensis]ADV67166.1 Lysine exporter protein (LYSE/YGGA) [Deinococcus maricopensis DSM 21211]
METLLAIAALHIMVLVVPGPDVLLVSQTAVARSRRAALFAGLGIVMGIACWAGLALLGIQVLFEHFTWVHGFIKVAGGLYLLYMGYTLWRASLRPQPVHTSAGGVDTPSGDLRAVRSGFLTNIANPKAAVFFGSVFSSVLGAHSAPGLKLAAFVIIVALSAAWFTLVALGMSTARLQAAYLRGRRVIDRVAGTLMAGFGALLLASRE